ncbi:MAG: 5-oxoprolinase subunit PxpA [Vicinamibacterales bacterium]
MPSIDLNSDLGESFGRWALGDDAELMASISSCNIACGYHAGDPEVMRRTVRLARDHGVAIGAHPGLPDLVGFGRRAMSVTAAEVEDFVLYQIGALAAIAKAEGVALQHVKPHGALYNMAIKDRGLADGIARAVASFDPRLLLFSLPGTELLRAGEAAGLPVAAEGFADRSYEADGSLTPRSQPDAVIHDAAEVVTRSVRMAREGVVLSRDGEEVPMRVATICTHGDTPGSQALVRRIRAGLERAGIKIRAAGGE